LATVKQEKRNSQPSKLV